MVTVLVKYYCITNHPNIQWLKAMIIIAHKLMGQLSSLCDLVQAHLISSGFVHIFLVSWQIDWELARFWMASFTCGWPVHCQLWC